MLRGLIVAGVHLAMVLSVGGKLLYDRSRLPREWHRVVPYDPNLPIRGRYVRLRLERSDQPLKIDIVAFFIAEHVADPSIRKPDEELWAEVTIPKNGPPRPIQLAVKKDGKLTPLKLD